MVGLQRRRDQTFEIVMRAVVGRNLVDSERFVGQAVETGRQGDQTDDCDDDQIAMLSGKRGDRPNPCGDALPKSC